MPASQLANRQATRRSSAPADLPICNQGLPLAHPGPRPRVGFKRQPADFCVDEQLAVPPTGVGPHLYLRARKMGLETTELAERLAQFYGVPGPAVGYAGRKDKRAVATQWFSVATESRLAPHGWEGCTVRDRGRGPRKLRPGDHAGNRFQIRLRGVDGDAWVAALRRIARQGVPNYFGGQRFAGNTLQRAQQWLGRQRRQPLRSGWYLSVLRSWLFNQVLAARVADGTWNKLVDGDPVEEPTGPLWGRGQSLTSGAARRLESGVLACHADLCRQLEHTGLRQARRGLVLQPQDLRWEHPNAAGQWAARGDLQVSFQLPPGGYATSVLREAFTLVEGDANGV